MASAQRAVTTYDCEPQAENQMGPDTVSHPSLPQQSREEEVTVQRAGQQIGGQHLFIQIQESVPRLWLCSPKPKEEVTPSLVGKVLFPTQPRPTEHIIPAIWQLATRRAVHHTHPYSQTGKSQAHPFFLEVHTGRGQVRALMETQYFLFP